MFPMIALFAVMIFAFGFSPALGVLATILLLAVVPGSFLRS